MDLPANRQQTMRGLSPGTRLGRYKVVRRVGSGGMAELYLARLDGPNGFVKPVALKLMHPHLSDDAHFARMFLKEARIAAALQHPAIAHVLDVGEFGGEYFMALEYVHGKDLRNLLSDVKAPLPLGAALRVVLEVARALQYAHRLRDPGGRALGIVHRDVSPSNILLSFQGVVKLADFGVAKMTERTQATATGTLKGKMGYMSPEQCLQEHVDARSDVFSLGVVLYEATTGRRAFWSERPATVMNRVIDGEWTAPERIIPDFPRPLQKIIAKALETDVERRYATAEAMGKELEAYARVANIEIGPEQLSGFLGQVYGYPAMPDLTVPALEVPRLRSPPLDKSSAPLSGTIPDYKSHSRRFITGMSLVGVLTVGGVMGWQVARSTGATRAEPVPRTIERDPSPAAIVSADAEPKARRVEPTQAPIEPLPEPELIIFEEEPVEPAKSAKRSRPSSRRTHRRRRRPGSKSANRNSKNAGLDSLLPPSAR